MCEALESTREDPAITAFEQLFLERGLPAGDPLRQRRALRQPQRAVQPVEALRLVAPARHRDRAHQARPSAAERPPRAHASDPEEGGDPTAGMNSLQQQARFDAFVSEFNTERPHEALAMKCPAELYAASPRPLCTACPSSTYPLPRPRRPRHRLRPHLHASQEDQHLDRAGRPDARHQGSRRRHLARQLHALRSRIHRPGAEEPCNPSTTRSARGCHPCLRYVLSPMCSGLDKRKLERAKGFEPSTPTLARLCSTPELHPHPRELAAR